MRRICKKCGFANDDAGITVEAACPQCGGIYAKTDIAVARAMKPLVQAETAEIAAPPRVSIAEKILWIITVASAGLGAMIMIAVEFSAKGAPQEAAGAAIAAAMAVIPYCIARAVQEYKRR